MPVEAWDEAKIEQALKNLKDLHIQLRELRSTIPRMQKNLGGPVTTGKATLCSHAWHGLTANTYMQLANWLQQSRKLVRPPWTRSMSTRRSSQVQKTQRFWNEPDRAEMQTQKASRPGDPRTTRTASHRAEPHQSAQTLVE